MVDKMGILKRTHKTDDVSAESPLIGDEEGHEEKEDKKLGNAVVDPLGHDNHVQGRDGGNVVHCGEREVFELHQEFDNTKTYAWQGNPVVTQEDGGEVVWCAMLQDGHTLSWQVSAPLKK